MENSKQRLYQKLLWQAVNLLSQLPRVYTVPITRKPPGPLGRKGHGPTACRWACAEWLPGLPFCHESTV